MSENTLWILLTVVGVAGALVIGLGLNKLFKMIRQKDETFQHPLLMFRYRAHDVNAIVEKLDGMGIGKLFDRFSLMMVFMMAEVLVVLMVVTHNITAVLWLSRVMYALSGVVWLAGSAEALLLRKSAAAAGVCSLCKWGAFAVWTIGMFAGLFVRSAAL